MIGIHPVHRRLAELTIIAEQKKGFDRLSAAELTELYMCLRLNAKLVRRLDELKNLAFVAHCAGDHEWEQDICRQIDALEVTML